MNDYAVKVENLTKKYTGSTALADINLSFPAGQITGLIGPNGSGKSTLLKIIAGLVIKDIGQVDIPVVKSKNIMDEIAFLPEINHLYNWMKVEEAVSFFNDQYQDFSLKKAHELIDFMNLKKTQKIKELSKGMVGRLKLVLTLARQVPLLIMDEPLSGIDPNSRARILESLISEYDAEKQSIIISTHEVMEAERYFDYVIFLENSKVKLSGNADDLRAEYNKSIQQLVREVFQ